MPEKLFELNPEKIEIGLSANRQGKVFRLVHELRAPSQKEWIDYDRALNVVMEDVEENGERGTTIRDNQARAKCDLWDRIALRATGYTAEPTSDWKLVPPGHKQASIACLLNIGLADGIDESAAASCYLDSSDGTVILSAIREELFLRLVHRFQTASKSQCLEFQSMHSESVVVKGKGKARNLDRVLLPSRMKDVVALYDALIIGVEGYSVGGVEPRDSEEIIRFMDAQHKCAALRGLMGSEQVITSRLSRPCPKCEKPTSSLYVCEHCGAKL